MTYQPLVRDIFPRRPFRQFAKTVEHVLPDSRFAGGTDPGGLVLQRSDRRGPFTQVDFRPTLSVADPGWHGETGQCSTTGPPRRPQTWRGGGLWSADPQKG